MYDGEMKNMLDQKSRGFFPNDQEKIMGSERHIPPEMAEQMPPKVMGMPPDHPLFSPDVDSAQGGNGYGGEHMPQQHMQQEMMDENPFDADQYGNVGLPDMPIGGQGGMAEALINDNEVPKEIRKKHWYVFHKDNVLGFTDDKRKEQKMLELDITKIDDLHTTPYYDYNFEKEKEWTLLRSVLSTKLDRAMGIKGNVKNERIILQSQFTENKHINESDQQSQMKDGFFKRLLGRR